MFVVSIFMCMSLTTVAIHMRPSSNVVQLIVDLHICFFFFALAREVCFLEPAYVVFSFVRSGHGINIRRPGPHCTWLGR